MAFAMEWKDASSERADAQTFWEEFFAIFGIKRRSVASFEEKVRNLGGAWDRIDVFYSGVMIGEHKSRGEDLSKAASQAFDYVQSLTRQGRLDEIPRFIVVSDFARITLYDLESDATSMPVADFPTAKLHEHIRHFGFLSGYTTKPVDPEDPINIRAVKILGNLHEELEKGGYTGHKLERFLVRVLFCLFADDTGIFEPDIFKSAIEATREDGGDLGMVMARLFKVLDQKEVDRPKNLPDYLKALPYVNGLLFSEDLGFAEFTAPMRAALIKCCNFHWAGISPAIFGSLFQSIMAGKDGKVKRRQAGAHYTSERDILKLIRNLFLDELRAELASCGRQKKKLEAFHQKLASLRFLDPACGCGNFLVVAYRELRLIELDTLLALYGGKVDQAHLLVDFVLKVDVDQMYGIEIDEWPARIAEAAMWLIDHQMNLKVGEAFGKWILRVPLTKSAKIHVGNALQLDWNELLPAAQCSYVLGNPPFVGAKFQSDSQRHDINTVAPQVKNAGLLDYVGGWYLRASSYIQGTRIKVGFVSTNSITQGEQVGVLWPELFQRGIKIHFAHQTFQWMRTPPGENRDEGNGKAHVHVVIVGFGAFDIPNKVIFEYPDVDADPVPVTAANISPYLTPGPDVAIGNRSTPLCESPIMGIGNKPIDDGNYLFTTEEMKAFVKLEPASKPFFRPWAGSEEFINGEYRWCLWLGDVDSIKLRSMPMSKQRVDNVAKFRKASKSLPTRNLADAPRRFHVENMPNKRFLVIPKVSSERRDYIPIGFMDPTVLIGDAAFILQSVTLFHFGVLTSKMHMAWVRHVCGRLKSDYRYSNKLVYNNFPWPQTATDKQHDAVEAAARKVLDTREQFKDQSLADLYDPLAMPKALHDAHKALDRAVDKCYRAAAFDSDRARVEFLFNLYQHLLSPLTASNGSKPRTRSGKPGRAEE